MGRTAVNFHDRSQLMGDNSGSSDEAMSSSDDSVSSSDDSVSSGDGSVSDHGVGGVRGDGGNVGNSGNDVGLLGVDGNMDGLVDGGGVRSDDSLGRVDIVGGVVDMGGLNNLLDGVDLVGGGNGNSTGNSNLVRGGHMLVHDDLTLDGNGDMDGDVNVVVLYIELGDDVGLLGSDPGVSPHGGEDPLLDHGVSRSGSLVGGSRGDGSKSRGGSVRDHGRGQGTGLNGVHGRSSDAGYSGLGNVFNSGNSVLVATNNRDLSSLHNLVSDNSVLNTVLNNGSSSSVGVVGLAYNSGGRSHRGTVGHSGASSVSTGCGNSRAVANNGGASGVGMANCGEDGWGAEGAAHEGKCDHKSVHVVTALFRRDSPCTLR